MKSKVVGGLCSCWWDMCKALWAAGTNLCWFIIMAKVFNGGNGLPPFVDIIYGVVRRWKLKGLEDFNGVEVCSTIEYSSVVNNQFEAGKLSGKLKVMGLWHFNNEQWMPEIIKNIYGNLYSS